LYIDTEGQTWLYCYDLSNRACPLVAKELKHVLGSSGAFKHVSSASFLVELKLVARD
jgi:hypothetical protein